VSSPSITGPEVAKLSTSKDFVHVNTVLIASITVSEFRFLTKASAAGQKQALLISYETKV